jgi:predicted glycosyltransferase
MTIEIDPLTGSPIIIKSTDTSKVESEQIPSVSKENDSVAQALDLLDDEYRESQLHRIQLILKGGMDNQQVKNSMVRIRKILDGQLD